MHKTLPFALLLAALSFYLPGVSQRADVHFEHLGLIGELTFHKQTAENHAIRVFNNRNLSDTIKSEVIMRYNRLRVGYDQLLLQLISDLHSKKRLWYFKNLDKYFYYGKIKNRRKVKFFIENWQQLVLAYDAFMSYPDERLLNDLAFGYPSLKDDNLELEEESTQAPAAGIKLNPLDPIGSAGSLFNIYKNVSGKNAFRARNITEMLSRLRMRDPAELIAQQEEELKVEVQDQED